MQLSDHTKCYLVAVLEVNAGIFNVMGWHNSCNCPDLPLEQRVLLFYTINTSAEWSTKMIQQVKNDEDLASALTQIDKLWAADKGTTKGDLLELLSILVQEYEDSLLIEERKYQPEVHVRVNDL